MRRRFLVVLALCVNWIEQMPRLGLRGHTLSIHEASDTVAGPCEAALAGSQLGPVFEELVSRTGKGHGAFYAPDPAWFGPAVRWCRER